MRKILFIVLFGASFILLKSCKDDGFPVPVATTESQFTYTMSNDGFAPSTVSFTDNSVIPDHAGEVSYFWSFGDETTSTEINPEHLYSTPGEYVVKLLLVTTQSGEIVEHSESIIIKDPNASGVPFFFWAGNLRSTLINEDDPIVSTINTPGLTSSYGMVVDTVANKIYVGDDSAGKIYSLNENGTGLAEFRSSVGAVNGLTIDYQTNQLYWGTEEGEVRRASLTITTLTQMETVVTGQDYPLGLAIDPVNRKLYWNNYNGGVWSKGLDVVGGESKIIDNPEGGGSVIVVGDRLLYDEYTEGDIKIRSANLNGGDLQLIVSGISRLVYAAVVYNPKDGKLYWGDRNNSVIRRANLNGSNVEDYYKTDSEVYPRAFALGKPK